MGDMAAVTSSPTTGIQDYTLVLEGAQLRMRMPGLPRTAADMEVCARHAFNTIPRPPAEDPNN